MEPSTFIAALAVVIAVPACVYAARSASSSERAAHAADRSAVSSEDAAESARRANDLAHHKQRLEIYKAFQEFHMHTMTSPHKFSDIDHWKFLHAANLSEFYFPEHEFEELVAISHQALAVKAAYALFETLRDNHDPEVADAMRAAVEEGQTLHRMFDEVNAALRVHLRLMPPPPPAPPANPSI